jgi:transcriptional regulatory protein LevR
MRKVDIAGMDLESIYESLLNFKGYEAVDTHEGPVNTQEAIVTICSSGHGAAMKIKALVEDVLRHAGRIIEVIPVGVLHLDDRLAEIAKEYRLVAAVGMKKPAMNVPFIPLEQLIDGEGERLLTELVFNSESALESRIPQGEGKGNMVVQRLCEESLQRFLTYLNPAKIMSVLLEFDKSLEKDLQLKLSNPLRVRLLVHCGCALERVVTRSPLVYKEDKSLVDKKKLMALKKAAQIFDETLKLRFDEDEYYFMANML